MAEQGAHPFAGSAPLSIRRPVGHVLRRLLACRRAQDSVEYVLLVLLIALATTVGIMAFANAVGASYEEAASCYPVPGKGPADDVPGIGPPDCKGGRSK